MFRSIVAELWMLMVLIVATTAADDSPVGQYHKWTDSTGRFGVEAQFVGVTYDRENKTSLVTLRKRDGTLLNVDVTRLSGDSKALAIRLNRALRARNRQNDDDHTNRERDDASARPSEGASASVPVFDVHFCVITKNRDARDVATIDQLKKEGEILNKYFVTEKRNPIIRFRFKSAHLYEDVADLECGFVELGDGEVPYDTDGWADRFNKCPHPQVRDPSAINFYVYDSYGSTGAADKTSHGKRNSNRPYVLIDWERLDHRIQSPEEHEMGHAFGLGHVYVEGATSRTSTNIMASRHAGGSGGVRDIGFNPEQVKTILHHAAVTHQRLYGQPMTPPN